MSVTAPERLNASLLLDDNLEAGRADKPALIGDRGSFTYGDVARLAARTASLLRELGVAREDRVLMVLDDSPCSTRRSSGAMRIGAVPIPVNPMDRPDNYAYYLDDSYATAAGRRGGAAGEARAGGRRAAPAARAGRQRRRGRALSFDEAVAGPPDELSRAGRHPPRRHGVLAVQLGLHRASQRRRARPARHRRRPSTPTPPRPPASPRTTSATRRPSSSTPTGWERPLVPDGRRRHRRAGHAAARGRTGSSTPSPATTRRCSSPCPRCTRRC